MNKQQADLFKQGTLELLILRLLSSGSLNGWDIMQRIEVLSGDVLTVTAGPLPGTPSPRIARPHLRRLGYE